MKYSIERLPESQLAVDVELDETQVQQALDKAARRISQRRRIPGFRPGKAPRYIVEARFGRAALYEEAADELVRESYREILQQEEIEPFAEAELGRFSFEPFSFRLLIPLSPTVTLGDYASLRFDQQPAEVTEDQVQQALEQLQDQQTIWKAPDPPRPARLGDQLVVDVESRDAEGTTRQQNGSYLLLKEQDLRPEFVAALSGSQVGQTVEVVVPPRDEDTKADAEETEAAEPPPTTYQITVQAIKEAESPPLDDDFARSFSDHDSLAELRAHLRGELEKVAEKQAREQVLEGMLTAIVEGAEVDMPALLVEAEAESLFHNQEEQLRSSPIGMPQLLEYMGKTEEEYRQELRESARQRVRRTLVLQEMIRAAGLAVAEGEVAAEVERLIHDRRQAAGSEQSDDLVQTLSTPEAQRELISSLLSQKLEAYLLAIACGELSAEPADEGGPDAPEEEAPVSQPEGLAHGAAGEPAGPAAERPSPPGEAEDLGPANAQDTP